MEDRQTKILLEMKVDIAITMARFMQKEDFYYRMLHKFAKEEHIHLLTSYMESGEYEKAFLEAHTIKGECANLGLGLVLENMVPLTEELRHPPYQEEEIKRIFVDAKKDYLHCLELISQL